MMRTFPTIRRVWPVALLIGALGGCSDATVVERRGADPIASPVPPPAYGTPMPYPPYGTPMPYPTPGGVPGTTQPSVGYQPPAIDLPLADLVRDRPSLSGVEYDYDFATRNIRPSSVLIRMRVSNPAILAATGRLAVGLVGSALKDTSVPVLRAASIVQSAGPDIVVAAEGFEPATVYRLSVYFFDRQPGGTATKIGAPKRQYDFATDGLTPVDSARARIVERALGEAYLWELDRYDRSKDYAFNTSGGWCDTFYGWTIKEDLNNRYPADTYGYWKRHNSLSTGGDIVGASLQGPIHGDNIRIEMHSAMLLAYDRSTQKVYTVEGNFNNRVMLWKRSVSGSWRYGRIVPSMLRVNGSP